MWWRRRPPRTDWTGWTPPDPVVEEIRAELRRRSWRGRIAFIPLVLAISYGFYDAERDRADVVQKARYQCTGTNQLREFQGQALEYQIAQTKTTLKSPNGLGVLEPFRAQVKQQQADRVAQLARLRAYTADYPVAGHPYRVDCVKAHRLPSRLRGL